MCDPKVFNVDADEEPAQDQEYMTDSSVCNTVSSPGPMAKRMRLKVHVAG